MNRWEDEFLETLREETYEDLVKLNLMVAMVLGEKLIKEVKI